MSTSTCDVALDGEVFVCQACGKTARERYGNWDTSCMTWAVLCYENSIERDATGRIVAATVVVEVEHIAVTVDVR